MFCIMSQGPYIMGAPFRLTVSLSEFDLPIISVPGMMTGFRFGDVGIRYYALFTANFPVCGQQYGNPQVRCDKKLRERPLCSVLSWSESMLLCRSLLLCFEVF
jgi:hypothetical protein